MENIRSIGLAYFANLSPDQMQLANKFFNEMFNSRSQIGFDEYLVYVGKEGLTKIANKDCFDVLDADKSGSLNREEAKPLYYISRSKIIISCNKCGVLMTGSFFSCFQCYTSTTSKDTFDLCCDCYEGRRFQHHNDAIFYDNQYLLFIHRDRSQQGKKSELQLTAEAYYQTVPKDGEIKAQADEFFNEMLKYCNNEINLNKYSSYMKELGFEKMANLQFFNKLNESGSGRLDKMEVMTLYYIIKSRRPFCDVCKNFVDGLFFTCYKCFSGRDDKTFNVCPSCFMAKNHGHKHSDFVDNYALLESKRVEAIMEKMGQQGTNQETGKAASYAQARPTTSTSRAIVPYDGQQGIRWLSLTSSLTGIVAGVTSIFANCSIM